MRQVMSLWPLAGLIACGSAGSSGDALRALDEGRRVQAAHELVWEPMELAADLEAGAAPLDLAEDLESLWSGILSCAQVTREATIVRIDHGDIGDDCRLNGVAHGGVHVIDVLSSDEEDGTEVRHTWSDFTDGAGTLDGTAVVGLPPTGFARSVAGDWTYDDGVGDATDLAVESSYTLEDPVLALRGPVQVEGGWDWFSNAEGSWAVGFDGVRFRLTDPVPEAGTWNMIDPSDDSLALTFRRIDAGSIEVVVTGLARTVVLTVTQGGTATAQ